MVRLDVAEAAHRLGISEAAVRKRVQRGRIPHERDDDGRLFVWVSPGETRHASSREAAEESSDITALVEEMRDRLRYVEGQLEAERQAHAEARRLLFSALEKIPSAIEAPSEPPGGPETATEGGGEGRAVGDSEAQEPSEALGGSGSFAGSGTARGSWWRRMFGG